MDTIEYPLKKSPYKLIPMPKEAGTKAAPIEAGMKAQPAPPAPKCSKCNSLRIINGSISDSYRGRCFFAPAGLRFWTITKSYGTKVESNACMDCGLVWLQTPPKMLEEFVGKYCDQKAG